MDLDPSKGDHVTTFDELLESLKVKEKELLRKLSRRQSKKRKVPTAKRVWDEYDREGLGEIDVATFRRLYTGVCGSNPTDEDFDLVVRVLDQDGNGRLSYSEVGCLQVCVCVCVCVSVCLCVVFILRFAKRERCFPKRYQHALSLACVFLD